MDFVHDTWIDHSLETSIIMSKFSQLKFDKEEFIKNFISPIKEKLISEGYKFTIKSRVKSIQSIYNKMSVQNIPFDQVYDLFGVRIILDCDRDDEIKDCWRVFSIVTSIYVPNKNRTRDWISTPRENGYESLHTTVITDIGQWVEVQIRTTRMDNIAEIGSASHWKYKMSYTKKLTGHGS